MQVGSMKKTLINKKIKRVKRSILSSEEAVSKDKKERKLRNAPIEREQSQACLNYAKCRRFGLPNVYCLKSTVCKNRNLRSFAFSA